MTEIIIKTGGAMQEKRKLKRRQILYHLRIFNAESRELMGRLVDINAEGLMIVSEDPVRLNDTFRLEIVLPESILGKDIVQMEARSLWSKADANPALFVTGFQFLNPPGQEIETIIGLILKFGVED